jgi:hypothetical protein
MFGERSVMLSPARETDQRQRAKPSAAATLL